MRATATPLQAVTVRASGAIAIHRCVGFDDAQATVAAQKVLGVAARGAADGELVAIETAGTTIVEAGAEITRGQGLACDAQGRAVPAAALAVAAGATAMTSGAANGAAVLEGGEAPQHVFADALDAAAAAGALIEVKLR